MAFVQQELGNWGSSCQVNQEHLMKGLLQSVCWAASGRHCKPKGLIKGFLWRSDKADSRGQDAGPQTGCDPHTCLVALYSNMSVHSGHAHTDTSLLNCYLTTHILTEKWYGSAYIGKKEWLISITKAYVTGRLPFQSKNSTIFFFFSKIFWLTGVTENLDIRHNKRSLAGC